MTVSVGVTYDKSDDIIVQHIRGDLNPDDFDRLEGLTAECVARLVDKSSVRILVDASQLRHLNQRVRKHAMKRMEEAHAHERVHLAFWNASPIERMFIRFMEIVRGTDSIKAFDSEQQAREWLRSRSSSAVNASTRQTSRDTVP